jgi:hypothetical protein
MKSATRFWVIIFAVLATSGLISAGTAHAGPPQETYCYWISTGSVSNCDGLGWYEVSSCQASGVTKEIDAWNGPVRVTLQYMYGNGGCRSVMARMAVYAHVTADAECYVKVQRNSDGSAYYAGVDNRGDSDAYSDSTSILYDAGVTSYAWGRCWVNGTRYDARTSNW